MLREVTIQPNRKTGFITHNFQVRIFFEKDVST